ncbi:MAG: hypothetical protein ABI986_11685, partial [Chloroflexota bacterium]
MKKICILYILLIWTISACSLTPLIAPPNPDFVLVTPNPNALPSSTPFQPADANYVPVEEPTLASTFTPLP